MSSLEFDPLTGLPRKKTPGLPPNQAVPKAWAMLGGPSMYDGPGGGDPGIPTGYNPLAPATTTPASGMPDYTALINKALGPYQEQLRAEGDADLTGRDNSLIRALGQFGEQWDLGSATSAFGEDFVKSSGFADLLPKANALAAQTTGAGMSYKARSEKAHKDAVRQIQKSLAARGGLRSGELGHGLQEQQSAFDTGQYDARSQVQDFMQAINEGYAKAVSARATALSDRQREEAARQAQLNPGVVTPPATPAPSLPTTSAPAPGAGELPWQRALRLRSEALNRQYGLGGGSGGSRNAQPL